MGPTLGGMGLTFRNQQQRRLLDPILRGHSAAQRNFMSPEMMKVLGNEGLESSLNHPNGKRFIICGDTAMGSDHVCSG